jgi:hypothetical protein
VYERRSPLDRRVRPNALVANNPAATDTPQSWDLLWRHCYLGSDRRLFSKALADGVSPHVKRLEARKSI